VPWFICKEEKEKGREKMFYSLQILAKKGPLGIVWIAAHLDRRLKRHQVFDTSIPNSVGALAGSVRSAVRRSSLGTFPGAQNTETRQELLFLL
jgi:N terminus of Rad21 / Rec8 like protein